ncbi:MAG: alpha/beta hydrolase [Acidobacteriota bacterium]|nr:alpha/beta hydrolase [Acidobacteriota bacterium]
MDVPANGTTLYAEQAGDGPSLVFVHGMCGDARVWSGQVERLRGRFHCVTYDRRGHTRSARTDTAESVELHADDLAGLIEALELAPCVVVGSSGGARIVVDFIRRYPALVRGAVASEPPIGALAPEAFAAMIGEVGPAVKRAADAGDARAAVDAFFEVICPGLWSAIDEQTKDRYRENALMLFADLGMPPYQLTESDAATITAPTVVIGGTHSNPALLGAARTLADWLPNSRYVELDCGHVTYAERPDEFARTVAEFAAAL